MYRFGAWKPLRHELLDEAQQAVEHGDAGERDKAYR
jgi:hypothetical protein